MVKPFSLIAVVAFATTLTSCFKDEALNNECDIEKAWIQVDNPDEVFFQPSNAELPDIESTKTDLIFPDLRPNSDVTALPVYFKVTDGATIAPENGSVQNFADGPVTYVVTSEDGQYNRTYRVYIKAKEADPTPDPGKPEDQFGYVNYNFEKYFLDPASSKFYVWSDYENGNNWATGNPGFKIAKGSAKPDQYPSTPLAEGYDGAAVKLETCDTGAFGVMVNMRIAAGNLFTGVFDSKSATKAPLKATHFGDGSYNQINYRPVTLAGYYQYTPGEVFKDKKGKEVEGRIDQGDIYAVVFRNVDSEGKSFYLTGDNVLTSPQIVALARVPNVVKTEGGWQNFSVDFNYSGELDPAILANYGYSMAVVFTSSIEGAAFQGAVGSTLLIDKVSIAYKK